MLELTSIVGDAPNRMYSLNTMRALILTGLGLAAAVVVSAYASEAQPAVTKASDWLGHVVTTRDGKELGTVRDIAIDERTGNVVYLVVSVGSFLIENNLIAVAPDALVRASTQDSVWLLDADPNVLAKAERFASDSHWPAAAGVVRDEGGSTAQTAAADTGESAAAAARPAGTATIESRSKTAHLSASERVITQTPPAAPPPPAPQASKKPAPAAASRLPPITPFDTLDKDGDGVLNRSEFAHEMSPKDSYSKVDANANGVIDRNEFDAFESAGGPAN